MEQNLAASEALTGALGGILMGTAAGIALLVFAVLLRLCMRKRMGRV